MSPFFRADKLAGALLMYHANVHVKNASRSGVATQAEIQP